MDAPLTISLVLLLLFVLGITFAFVKKYLQYSIDQQKQLIAQNYATLFAEWKHKALNEQSTKAVTASRNTIKGQVYEQVYPLMRVCPYLPSDMKFFGAPIDYIVISGMTEERDGEGSDIEIIFMDIKTGNAVLSPIQRKIQRAIQSGKVRWETVRIGGTNDESSIVARLEKR